jgi:hypothetical protein
MPKSIIDFLPNFKPKLKVYSVCFVDCDFEDEQFIKIVFDQSNTVFDMPKSFQLTCYHMNDPVLVNGILTNPRVLGVEFDDFDECFKFYKYFINNHAEFSRTKVLFQMSSQEGDQITESVKESPLAYKRFKGECVGMLVNNDFIFETRRLSGYMDVTSSIGANEIARQVYILTRRIGDNFRVWDWYKHS